VHRRTAETRHWTEAFQQRFIQQGTRPIEAARDPGVQHGDRLDQTVNVRIARGGTFAHPFTGIMTSRKLSRQPRVTSPQLPAAAPELTQFLLDPRQKLLH
jgi:hypothetical protein